MTTPPAPASDNSAQILIKLGEMAAQLAVMGEQLKSITDHEQRIRALERWKYSLPVALLMALTSVALTAYGAVHH